MCEDRKHNWLAIFSLAQRTIWAGKNYVVRANLRLAINSLSAQTPGFWEKDPKSMEELLEKNKGVKKIFQEFTDEEIAYCIRLARLSQPERSSY